MQSRLRYKMQTCYIVAFSVLVFATSTGCRRAPSTKQPELWKAKIFKEYILDPIPKSVANTKVDELDVRGLGHRYVMRFEINKEDVASILNTRPYKEFISVTYDEFNFLTWHGSKDRSTDLQKGSQHFDLGTGGGIPLYSNEHQTEMPEWFRPNELTSPKAYVVREKYGRSTRYRTKILIFDEDKEQAYFIEYLPGH